MNYFDQALLHKKSFAILSVKWSMANPQEKIKKSTVNPAYSCEDANGDRILPHNSSMMICLGKTRRFLCKAKWRKSSMCAEHSIKLCNKQVLYEHAH